MHLDRISDIAHTECEHYLSSDRSLTDPITGKIELKHVSYRYSENEHYIFEDISLCIEPGESVAIVGPSGCGKTTLLKVMMGLIQPTSGEVLVDGINIQHLGLRNYRSNTASVMQDDTLMSGSISDNISFFDPQVDQQRIHHCAVASHIAEDIIKMPMGFQTLVGDLGNTLSGGQQQRLLLARALYRNPKILFLDEASSHLDIETEKIIVSMLSQIGITRIMIAHRPESISSADRVIDISNGTCCDSLMSCASY
jgi:ATP-binding cassette subfamily B protein RaxB